MTLNEIVFLLADKLPNTESPPSFVLTQQLEFTVIYYRAMFLRRDYTENTRFPTAALQLLELETEVVDAGESSLVTLGCMVRRTKREVPEPVRLKNWQQFKFVGAMNSTTGYTPASIEEVPFRLANKFTSKTACYYYYNKRIYVVNVTSKFIKAHYMLEDPRQAVCSLSYNPEDDFPLPADMLQGIIDGILRGELRLLTPPASSQAEVELHETARR